MKISMLQPSIVRGDILYNLTQIQSLIDQSKGELLILPEYALTGSLVLDKEVNLNHWVIISKEAKERIVIPKDKMLLINSIIQLDDGMYNCCELMPVGVKQCKIHPDITEVEKGIKSGDIEQLIRFGDLKYKVIICTDLRYIDNFNIDNLDFLLFIFHFTDTNYAKAMVGVKKVSKKYDIPVLVSSLVSDRNIGFSSYVYNNLVIYIGHKEGILEVEIG